MVLIYEDEHCRCELLDNGIHVFTLLTKGREAVASYYQAVGAMYQTDPQNPRTLVDFRQSGVPPVHLLVRGAQDFVREYQNTAPLRSLLVISPDFTGTLANAIITPLSRTMGGRWKWKLVVADHYEDGVHWLLQDT